MMGTAIGALLFCGIQLVRFRPFPIPAEFHSFHKNILHWNLLPSWNPAALGGLGAPIFEHLAPLPFYLYEVFYLISGQDSVALGMLFSFSCLIACWGALKLALRLYLPLTAAAFVGLAYAVSPLFLFPFINTHVSHWGLVFGAALLPWVCLHAALGKRSSALSIFLLILSAPALAIALFLILLCLGITARIELKKPLLSFALAASMSAFYWLPPLWDHKFWSVGISTSWSLGFLRFDELALWCAAALGLLTQTVWQPLEHRMSFSLSVIGFASGYALHRFSWFFHSKIAALFGTGYPPRIFGPVFILSMLLVSSMTIRKRHWAMTLLALAVSMGAVFSPWMSSPFPSAVPLFADAPLIVPSRAAFDFMQVPPKERVTLIKGHADYRCTDTGPTQLSCDVLAIRPTKLRFNILAHPGWKFTLDQKNRINAEIDPTTGAMLFDVPVGKHKVDLQHKLTTSKISALILSFIGLVSFIFLISRSIL